MQNPFTFRPTDPYYPSEFSSQEEFAYPLDDDTVEWEDNWLSNSFAWLSQSLFPYWCQRPTHWSSLIANYLWTSCACCLILRGAVVGFFFAIIVASILAILF